MAKETSMRDGRANQPVDVILVESDPISRMTIENYLAGQGVRVIAAVEHITTAMNLIRGIRPRILIAELPPNPQETLEAVRRVRHDYPNLGIILSGQETSSQLILRAVRAGAQEFLGRPIDIRELGEALARLTDLLGRTEESAAETGRIIAVCSNKGGVGVTSVATNLALALSTEGKKTVIVDLNLRRGDVEVMLDLLPSRTLGDILSAHPIDEVMLQGALSSYSPSLFLLAGPDWPEQNELLSSVRLAEVFGLLKNMFTYVVVDAGRTIGSHMTEILTMADVVLAVSVLDVVSVRNARNHIRVLGDLSLANGKVKLIVNRHHKNSTVNLEDFEKATGITTFWQIPNEYQQMSSAINTGRPVVIAAPRSRLARNLVELSKRVADLWSAPEATGNGQGQAQAEK